MPSLSLAMIVKNEEKNLGRCLASVRDLVDEMVVVDTGSTDGTEALAASWGAKVSRFAWTDDFSAARNESLRRCTGDWVLVLDADEAVDALDHGMIRRACEHPRIQGYELILRNYFPDGGAILLDQPARANDGKYAQGSEFGYYADFKALRLCRRAPDLQFEGRIHELLLPFFLRRGLPIAPLEAVIHHFGKLDPVREAEKAVRYLRLAEAQVAQDPGNPQPHYNLLSQALVARDWSRAVVAGEAYLALVARPKAAALAMLAYALQEADRYEEALPHLERLLALQADHPLALSRLVFGLARLGRYEQAESRLQEALRFHPRLPYLRKIQADLRLRQGQVAEAQAALKAGIEACPDDADLRTTLIKLDMTLGQEAQAAAEAWAALNAIPEGGAGEWHVVVSGFLLQEGNLAEARAVLAPGLARHPSHEGLQQLKVLADRLGGA